MKTVESLKGLCESEHKQKKDSPHPPGSFILANKV